MYNVCIVHTVTCMRACAVVCMLFLGKYLALRPLAQIAHSVSFGERVKVRNETLCWQKVVRHHLRGTEKEEEKRRSKLEKKKKSSVSFNENIKINKRRKELEKKKKK